jgi:precorrin-6B methylase 2
MAGTHERGQYGRVLALRSDTLPEFERFQAQAAASLSRLVSQLDARVVWDVGVGSGEIVAAIAATNPDTRFVGFDESRDMFIRAKRRTSHLKNVSVRLGRLPEYRPPGERADLAFFVGHTAPHFGAQVLSLWLRRLRARRPLVLCVDFIKNWDSLLQHSVSVEWRRFTPGAPHAKISWLTTLVDGRNVWRVATAGSVVQGHSRFPIGPRKVSIVRQTADPTQRYVEELRSLGYVPTRSLSYESGYGPMRALVFVTKM